MHKTTRIKITDLNPQLICVLCGGYYVDAATIIECLHSFCRTCIIRYLESSKYCPICDVMVHKTKPLENVKLDKTLQDLVYKLVPGLYKNEMKRRRECYAANPTDELCHRPGTFEERGDEDLDRIFYNEDEKISLALELYSECFPEKEEKEFKEDENKQTDPDKLKRKDVRYLQCPAGITVGLLKKFIRIKFDLPPSHKIDMYHSDDVLKESFTLMDIAYIYTWRRKAPLRLVYTIYELCNRKRKPEDQPEEEAQKSKQPCLTSQECQTNVTVLGDPESENKNDLENNRGKEQEQDRPLDLVKNSRSANKSSEETTKLTNGHDNSKESIIIDNDTPLFKDFIQSKLNKESNSQKLSKESNNQKNSKDTNNQKQSNVQKNSKETNAQKPLKEQSRNRKEKSKLNGHAPHPLNYKLHNGKLNGKEMYKISKETKRLINEMPEYGKVTKLNGIHSNTTNSVSEYEFVD